MALVSLWTRLSLPGESKPSEISVSLFPVVPSNAGTDLGSQWGAQWTSAECE